MTKVLIIQTASIGDVILATSLIEALHQNNEDTVIDILIKKDNEQLFNTHPYLHQVLLWDKTKNKYKNLWQIFLKTRNKYDLIINTQRFLSTGLLTILSNAKETTGFNKNPLSRFFTHRIPHRFGENIHEIDRNLSLIHWIIENPERSVKLYPSITDNNIVKQYKTGIYITISPSSLWFTKQFPSDKWIEFLQQIPKEFNVFLLGSKHDIILCDNIIQKAKHINSINLAGTLTLLQSAALMQDAHMNFVNDSASLHLCSAMNAPVTAIFCSTVPSFGFGPISTAHYIVENHQKLPCRPCGIHGHKKCPKHHFKCAYNINIKEILSRLQHECY